MVACCSWCHAAVLVPEERYCPHCGHRGDLARGFCDCPTCDRRGVDAALGAPVQVVLVGLFDEGHYATALADLVETALANDEPVADELVDALIAVRGLRIRT